jgi:hypothetical protein
MSSRSHNEWISRNVEKEETGTLLTSRKIIGLGIGVIKESNTQLK